VLNTHWYWSNGLSDTLKADNVISIWGEQLLSYREKGEHYYSANYKTGFQLHYIRYL